MADERKKLIEVKNVSLTFNKGKSNEVRAIDDVSFDIYEGEVFGLVGESGSGKTTIGRAILKLYDIDSGEIDFNGETISNIKGKKFDVQSIKIGTKVLHKAFGEGTVDSFKDDFINITFIIDYKKVQKTFKYPAAFIQGFLAKKEV